MKYKNKLGIAIFMSLFLLTTFIISINISFVNAAEGEWWNTTWTYKKNITLGQTGSSNLDDIIVNVTIDTETLISGGKLDSNCECLRLINSTSDGELYWFWENYGDSTYGCNTTTSQIWVQADIASTNSTIQMYYDSACESSGFGNNTGTLNAKYESIHMFGEGTGATAYDETGNSRDATLTNTTWLTTGRFGNTIQVPDKGAGAVFPDNADMESGTGTFCSWVRLITPFNSSASNDRYLFTKGNLFFGLKFEADDGKAYFLSFDGSAHTAVGTDTSWAASTWFHVCGTWGTSMVQYIDGAADGTDGDDGSFSDVSADWGIGNYDVLSPARTIIGDVDFSFFSTTEESADWVKRMYQQDLIVFSTEEGENTAPTTPTSITLDGTEADQNSTYYKDNINITINCSGSTDTDDDEITYYTEAYYNQTNETFGAWTITNTNKNWTWGAENAGATYHPDGKVYRYGGDTNSGGSLNDKIGVYNTSDNSVVEMTEILPGGRTYIYESVTTNTLDECNYIYGGGTPFQNNTIVKHCPSTGEVTVLSETLLTTLRYTCAEFYETWNSTVSCSGHITGVGGNGATTRDCFIHNFTDSTITNASFQLPANRVVGGCYIADDAYYYLGGSTHLLGGPSYVRKTIYKVNLSTGAVTTESEEFPHLVASLGCDYEDTKNVGICAGNFNISYGDEIFEINHSASTVTEVGKIPLKQDDFAVVCDGSANKCFFSGLEPFRTPFGVQCETCQKEIHEFNYTVAGSSAVSWHSACTHTNGTTCNWTITNVTVQTDIDFRCRAADLGGTGTNSSYFIAGSNVTIEETEDVTPPVISIQSPSNITYITNDIWFNVTLDKIGDTCFVDYGFGNETMTNSTGNWNFNNASMDLGNYEAIFYCNDTLGNLNSTSIFFTVGVFTITIDSPSNTTHTTTSLDLNITVNSGVDMCVYSLNGASNVTNINYYANDFFTLDESSNPDDIVTNDTFFWITDRVDDKVYKYDMNGNFVESWDTTANNDGPFGITQNGSRISILNSATQVIYQYLMDGTYANRNISLSGGSVFFRGLETNDTFFWATQVSTANKIIRYFPNGTKVDDFTTTSCTSPDDISFDGTHFWAACLDGVYKFLYDGTFIEYINTSTETTIGLSGIAKNDTNFWIVVTSEKRAYKYFTTASCRNTTITATQGTNNIFVWANDTSGNINSTIVYFTVDSIPPNITINIPENITYCDTDPELNFTFQDAERDSCWYSINSAANVTLATCETNGTVLSSNEGGNNVRLCINDTAGNEACDQVFYTKDSESPSITITNPVNDTIDSTNFDFTFGEDVDTAKYSIDSGTNVTNSDLTTSWSGSMGSLSQTTHNIEVWANDSCGHQNSSIRYFTIGSTLNPVGGEVYYNQFLLNFSNPEANTNATSCWFILNGGPPTNYTCVIWNNTISNNIGQNNLTLCWNNVSGTFCNETLYNVSIRCSAAELSDTICGGIGFSYILRCRQITANTYQFDYNNMTFCDSGCVNGTCINRTFCIDNCKAGDTMCNGNYVISCKEKSNGCYDWSSDDKVFCNKGCDIGKCLDCQDKCNSGDATCDNPLIRYCQDDNGDGCLEFSDVNTTTCEFGCFEDLNETTGINNVSCNYHSFGDIYAVRGAFEYGAFWFDYVFNTLNLKVWIVLIMMVGFGGIAGIKANKENEGGWKVGLLIMSGIIFAASWFEWMPWVVTILFLIFVVGVWFSDKRNQ